MQNFFIPISFVLIIYAVTLFIKKKQLFKSTLFSFFRFATGCIYIGYLISESINDKSFRFLPLIFIFLLGVFFIYNKYLHKPS